ncbi:MAG: carboxypeptidase regulatory-like domain-containing protein [Acidobacteria bacterium]|nr:carboxypeptidase regulatory-like domain-containing protein [Acidobacteriota bacterium]
MGLRRGGPGLGATGWTRRIGQDLTFKIDYLDPDRYGVQVDGLPDGFYTKSIHAGEADVLYSGVDLTSRAPAEVEILVSPKAGLVFGVVRNPDANQPAPGATVVLVPNDKQRLAIPAFYHQAASDQRGRFNFKNVAPGDYKVYAWEDVESTAWMDPEFMKPLESKGEAVTVAENAQATVQINLIPARSERQLGQ